MMRFVGVKGKFIVYTFDGVARTLNVKMCAMTSFGIFGVNELKA